MSKYDLVENCPPLPQVEGVEFRHCVGFPSYCVGSDGSVWSCRKAGVWRRMITAKCCSGQYLHATIWRAGKKHGIKSYRLITAAFLGPKPAGMEVRHLNGNATDNRVVNLAYGTKSENAKDTFRHGKSCFGGYGEKNIRAKLTRTHVDQILMLRAEKSAKELGKMFGIGQRHVYRILARKQWKS